MPDLRLTVPANGEARADWTASVEKPGEVKLKVTARGGNYADAMEKTFTAYEHGIEKFISKSGKVRGDDVTVKLVCRTTARLVPLRSPFRSRPAWR